MKKIALSLVVAVVAAWMSVPLLALNLQVDAHACCRTHGEHHCGESSAPTGTEHNVANHCPYRTGASSLTGNVAMETPRRAVFTGSTSWNIPLRTSVAAPFFITPETTGRAPPADSF